VRAIRGAWRGEGGSFRDSAIPPSGIERMGCPLLVAADGPKAAALAGEVGDGLLYGGTMNPDVQRRRLAAGRPSEDREAWIAPSVSLAGTHDGVREDLGAMVVAMANRAMRGDLDEREVPPEIQDDVRAMWRAYDYSFHADNSRPRNTGVVSERLSDHLIDTLCLWGDESRWEGKLRELEDNGWTGVMFILGQAEQLSVVKEVGGRLRALGAMAAP
jgi:5,10-methylenetetrahydromethanopterin reductase